MDARLALIPDDEDPKRGMVKPIAVKDGSIYYGLSIGHWTKSTPDGNIHLVLSGDIDTIIHEVATSKAVNLELRAAERDAKGIEKKFRIELDPITKRFKQVEI